MCHHSRKRTAADALLDSNAENDSDDDELYDAVDTMLLRPISYDISIDQESHRSENNQLELAKKKGCTVGGPPSSVMKDFVWCHGIPCGT
jgi:hypothetical protein